MNSVSSASRRLLRIFCEGWPGNSSVIDLFALFNGSRAPRSPHRHCNERATCPLCAVRDGQFVPRSHRQLWALTQAVLRSNLGRRRAKKRNSMLPNEFPGIVWLRTMGPKKPSNKRKTAFVSTEFACFACRRSTCRLFRVHSAMNAHWTGRHNCFTMPPYAPKTHGEHPRRAEGQKRKR